MISEELSGVIGNVAVYEPVFKPESYIESIAQDAHHSAFVDPQCVGDMGLPANRGHVVELPSG